MNKFVRDLFTADAESKVWDLVRVATGLAIVVGLSLVVYSVVRMNQPFDIQAFGTGFGLILAGGGGAMALRRDRESKGPGE